MKKIIAIILCILIVLGLCGWTNIHTEDVNPMTYIHIYVDDETGVEYVVTQDITVAAFAHDTTQMEL